MISSRSRRSGEPMVTGLLAVGAVVMVAGTFCPWLSSGSARRNLYGATGVVQRIAGLGQPLGDVLDLVPLVGLFLVLCGLLWALGQRLIAGLGTAVVALLLGLISAAALSHQHAGTVRIVALGPMITLVGAGITALGISLLPVLGRRAAAARRTPGDRAPIEPVPPARSSRLELS